MNEGRNDCDRRVLLRGLLFQAVLRTIQLAASAFEGPKYSAAGILIDVSSRSPQVRIDRRLPADIRTSVDVVVRRDVESFAPHKVRLQQIHTLSPMQGPSGLRSFVTQRPMGAWSRRRLALVPKAVGPEQPRIKLAASADVRDPSLSPPIPYVSPD
jgi:hypothetical protein